MFNYLKIKYLWSFSFIIILVALSSCTRPVLTTDDVSQANPLVLAKYVQQAVQRGDAVSANTFYDELIKRNMVREQHRQNVLNKKIIIGMTQYEVVTIAGYPYRSDISSTTTQYGEDTYWRYSRSYGYTFVKFDENNRVDYFSYN